MYLLLSIVVATILGFILHIFGSFGTFLAFGIVLGCLFRGLYLLNDLHKRLFSEVPKPDKAKAVLEEYLENRETLS